MFDNQTWRTVIARLSDGGAARRLRQIGLGRFVLVGKHGSGQAS